MKKVQWKKFLVEYKWTVAVVLAVFVVFFVKKGMFGNTLRIDHSEEKGKTHVVSLDGHKIQQYFNAQEELRGITVYLNNDGDAPETAVLSVYDGETDQLLWKTEDMVTAGAEKEYTFFHVHDVYPKEGQQLYYTLEGGENISVNLSKGREAGDCLDNGKKIKSHVQYVETYTYTRDWLALFLMLLAAIPSAVLLTIKQKKEVPLHKVFFALVMLAGIMLSYVNPPGQECDGWIHILRSLDVSYGNVMAPFVDITHEKGVIQVPENSEKVDFKIVTNNNGTAYVENLKSLHFSREVVEEKDESIFPSIYYWPQALGIAIGRLLGLSVFYMLMLSRIFNLAAYALLAAWAVKRTPIMKHVFMVVALLPITLYHSASNSPDALLVGLCLLFTALCFDYAYGELKEIRLRQVLALGILLSLLLMLKYVYVCIGLLVFLIPMDKFESKKKYFISFLVGILPVVIMAVVVLSQMTSSVELMSSSAGQANQVDFVRNNLGTYLHIMVRSMISQFNEYVNMLDILGWFTYGLGPLISIVPCYIVGVSLLDTNEELRRVKTWHKWMGLAVFIICYALVLTGLYLGDGRINPYGGNTIMGFQGRYFIPVLVPGLMLLSSAKVRHNIEGFSYKVLGISGLFITYAAMVLRSMCY